MSIPRRPTAAAIRARKGTNFTMMTAYDAAFARCAEEAGIDYLLVGDSLGNVVLGYASTAQVELGDIERHAAAVSRGTSRAHIVADLPFGTYEAADVDAAGAYAVVLEMVDATIAGEITRALDIPTIGIGSGPDCDGQVLVLYDLLGLYPEAPSFVKRYAELGSIATEALRTFAHEVRDGTFPGH